MTVEIVKQQGDNHQTVKIITLSEAADSQIFKLGGIENFVQNGVVFTFLPTGGEMGFLLSSRIDGMDLIAHKESPITENTVIHQLTTFQTCQISTTAADARVIVMYPYRWNFGKLRA